MDDGIAASLPSWRLARLLHHHDRQCVELGVHEHVRTSSSLLDVGKILEAEAELVEPESEEGKYVGWEGTTTTTAAKAATMEGASKSGRVSRTFGLAAIDDLNSRERLPRERIFLQR